MSKAADAEKRLLDETIKAFKNLIKSTDQLSGAQLSGFSGLSKAILQHSQSDVETRRRMVNTTKETNLGHAILITKEKMKKADEKLVRLRHVLNKDADDSHGEQVRRNIMLRHKFDDVGSSMNFLTNSIKGNFGFQAAIGRMTKGVIKGTATFDSLQEHSQILEKAKKDLSNVDDGSGSKKDKQVQKNSLNKKIEDLEKVIKDLKAGIGGGEKSKGLFGTLSKMGKFFEKKALPIGLGIGVAGVLMSVIVKSLSASPLFAQMMKMMKFAVTLVLMPLGTFFGALLRPILVMLLRKFIVPMYSTWMPIAMKVGGQIGNWVTGMSWENIYNTLRAAITGSGLPTYDPITGEEEPINKVNKTTDENDFGAISNPDYDPLDPNSGANATDKFQPKDGSDYDTSGNQGTIHVPKYIPDGLGGMKINPEWERPSDDPSLSTQGGVNMTPTNGGGGASEIDKIPTLEEVEAAIKIAVAPNDNSSARAIIEAAQEQARLDNEQRTADNEAFFSDEAAKSSKVEDKTQLQKYQDSLKILGTFGQGGHQGGARDMMKQNIGGIGEQAGKTWQDYIPAADGFNGMVNKPTMFLAGEAGSEHVSITPSGGSSGGGITVNIQNMNGSDNDLRKLKQTILEVIQQSSANRGRL